MESKEIHSFITDNFKDLYQYLGVKFEEIDVKFKGIDKRLDEVDARFEVVDKRLDNIDAKFEDIENGFVNSQNEFIKTEKGFEQQDLNHKAIISQLQEMNTKIDHNNTEQRFELQFLSARVDKIEKKIFKIESNQ